MLLPFLTQADPDGLNFDTGPWALAWVICYRWGSAPKVVSRSLLGTTGLSHYHETASLIGQRRPPTIRHAYCRKLPSAMQTSTWIPKQGCGAYTTPSLIGQRVSLGGKRTNARFSYNIRRLVVSKKIYMSSTEMPVQRCPRLGIITGSFFCTRENQKQTSRIAWNISLSSNQRASVHWRDVTLR